MNIFEYYENKPKFKPLTWALAKKVFKDSFQEIVPDKKKRNCYSIIHDPKMYTFSDGHKTSDCHGLSKKEVMEIADAMRRSDWETFSRALHGDSDGRLS